MGASGFFIDANLLVLLVAGSVDTRLIGRHRRLREFTVEQYEGLRELVGAAERVFVMPNTLTEASNLLRQHRDPERSLLSEALRATIEAGEEVVVASAVASRNRHFARLGLTDAALLEVATPETPLVTVDLDLYVVASKVDHRAAFNFNHLYGHW